MFGLTVASAILTIVNAQPALRTENGNVVIQVPQGGHIVSRVGDGDDVNLDELYSRLQSGVDSIQSNVDEALSSQAVSFSTMTASTNTRIDDLDRTTSETIRDVRERLAETIANVTSDLGDAVDTLNSNSIELREQIGEQIADVASSADLASRAAEAAYNASTCARLGLLYNQTTATCYSNKIGAPDFVSGWFPMRSQAGTQGYREIVHGLNVDPERVQVLIKSDDNQHSKANTLYHEAQGAGTCDDDTGCHDYGGMVYAYDNNRVRIWAPDRNNGRSYGRSIHISDGWGSDRRNIYVTYVQVMVRIWVKYRPGVSPSFDSTFTMTTAAANSYRQVTHTRGANINSSYPERVLVTVEATDGSNRGFKFVAKGASVVDNDSGKEYGGLVFAYNQGNLRLWAPSSTNGRIIFVADGWGGERNRQSSRSGRVRVRVWGAENAVEPDFESGTFEMCSNCRTGNCNRWTPTSYGWSYREIFHGLSAVPNYVKVETIATDGNNRNFVFEAITSGGADDENDGRTGLLMAYDNDNTVLWAPTRSNARTSGRILGVHDGWGNNRFNQASQCANVRVKIYN